MCYKLHHIPNSSQDYIDNKENIIDLNGAYKTEDNVLSKLGTVIKVSNIYDLVINISNLNLVESTLYKNKLLVSNNKIIFESLEKFAEYVCKLRMYLT